MTTIGQIEHHRQSNSNEHLQHLRRQCASIVREAARLSEGNVSPGTEVLRRFYLHDINTFTIEQDTTISLVDKGNRWTILIMSDSNGDGKSPALPLREVDGFEKSDFYLTPVIQMNRHRHHHSHTDKGELISVKSHESAQNTLALLPANYGQMLDSQIAMHDPFYALYELLDFFASSEAQFVNMMHHHLSRQVDLAGRSTDTPSLADFQYTSELLETHLDRLKRLTSIVINRHTLEWPQCERQELRDAANENEAIAKLITDLQYLADALDHLLRRAERGKDILIGNTGTQVAKQSFWQNQKLGKLTTIGTWVAMAYVPWSFITAVFGMNVVEPFSIWTWAAASAIVLSILLVALAIWKRRWLCETISRIRRRFSM
jgi:Mg2+ and Co2+ transporter CorA